MTTAREEAPAESLARCCDARSLRIRVLTFAGCPNRQATFDLVDRVASLLWPAAVVERIEVTSNEEAVRLRFLGSPTVQVNGIDIEPASRDKTDFAMLCRLYGRSGVPSPEMIAAAIREAAG